MIQSTAIKNRLAKSNKTFFAFYLIAASFITYFSMYAFRKPFSAGTFEGLTFWDIDYKVFAVFFQLIGYTTSKFFGIKLIAELKPSQRIVWILILMGIAWLALLFFAIVPAPYNLIFLFLNGLPLGMIWGVVYSFLEGRKLTELLGAGLSTSFILSSGVVKATGRTLILNYSVSEFWMPFLTGLLFVPALLLGVYMLSLIPPPTVDDEMHRTKRIPMDSKMRKLFFKEFSIGIILTTTIYIFLTIFRDIRDNFAVEIWSSLGYSGRPDILATSEIPIAMAVMIIIGLMILIENNRTAFYINILIIITAGFLLLTTTILNHFDMIDPVLWMIMNGFSMYLGYIAYHTFLYERWIAVFRYKSNIGFLMYIADAFGYMGSSIILFSKSFMSLDLNWLQFFIKISYLTSIVTIVFGIFSLGYFIYKEKQPIKIDLNFKGELNG